MTFVGVCGGRDYHDRRRIDDVLRVQIRPDDVIVHGDQVGADKEADAWAILNGRQVVRVPAIWNRIGKLDRGAGIRRNAVIAALPLRMVIAFPGHRGTADMVAKARAKGIEVMEVPE